MIVMRLIGRSDDSDRRDSQCSQVGMMTTHVLRMMYHDSYIYNLYHILDEEKKKTTMNTLYTILLYTIYYRYYDSNTIICILRQLPTQTCK